MPGSDPPTQPAGRRLPVAIRRASAGDAAVLVGIQAAASIAAFTRIFPPDRYPFPVAAVRERWDTELAGGPAEVYIAEEQRTPVGLVAVKPGWLEALYVLPSHWGAGIAARLHRHALDRLEVQGARTAKLWVLEHNDRARAFYERQGWRPNGETRVVPFPPEPLDVGYTLDLGAYGPEPARL